MRRAGTDPAYTGGALAGLLLLGAALQAQPLPPDLGFVRYTLTGEEFGDVYGHSLAAMGDIDGDGLPDFALGSIESRERSDALGEVLLVSGTSGRVIRSLRNAEAVQYGDQVFNCGDVDGDGLNDVVATGAGILGIHSSRDGKLLRLHRDPTGVIVLAAGDINGDGTPDVAIANPVDREHQKIEVHAAGSWDLVWGIVTGEGETLGSRMVLVDDMDADGARDIATNDLVTHSERGLIAVVQVRNSKTGSVIRTYSSPLASDSFGHEISVVSDIDGDLLRDLAVSAPRSPIHGFSRAGRVDVISTADGSLLWTQTGQDFEHEVDYFNGDEFGWSMTNVGDVTLDGKDDILVLSRRALIEGQTLARLSLCSGKDGAILATFEREDTFSDFGWILSPLGDIDGDARPEFLAVAPDYSKQSLDQPMHRLGRIYAFTYRPDQPLFVRADGDLDGDVDVTDAVVILEHLFRGKPGGCEDALDVNRSLRVNATDAVYLLRYLFQGSYAPEPPFPQCGSHESFRGRLPCERSSCQ